LLVEFVNDIARVGVVELDFTGADLAEENAVSSDTQTVEAFQRPSQTLDVASVSGERPAWASVVMAWKRPASIRPSPFRHPRSADASADCLPLPPRRVSAPTGAPLSQLRLDASTWAERFRCGWFARTTPVPPLRRLAGFKRRTGRLLPSPTLTAYPSRLVWISKCHLVREKYPLVGIANRRSCARRSFSLNKASKQPSAQICADFVGKKPSAVGQKTEVNKKPHPAQQRGGGGLGGMVHVVWVFRHTNRRPLFPEPPAPWQRQKSGTKPLASIEANLGEVDLGKPKWLRKPSAVNIQGLASIDHHSLVRKLGKLTTPQLDAVKAAIRDWVGL